MRRKNKVAVILKSGCLDNIDSAVIISKAVLHYTADDDS